MSRTYLIGLPVAVTVGDDGTVTVCTYLEDAADLESHDDDGISRADMIADSARIIAAFNASAIRVERSVGTVA